jgi:hypothetical protein
VSTRPSRAAIAETTPTPIATKEIALAALRESPDSAKTTQLVQGTYYVATGVWPVMHRRSFEAVSGRKHDFWLAETVGLITAAIGLSLCLASRRKEPSPEAQLLGVAAAAGFAAIDLRYGLTRRIRPVYLLDALLQLSFLRRALMARQ